MTTRHKHADAIIAWAEGKTVQVRSALPSGDWISLEPADVPLWDASLEYRAEPEEVVEYTDVDVNGVPGATFHVSKSGVDKNYGKFPGNYLANTYLQRTTIDGKVVEFKLVHEE